MGLFYYLDSLSLFDLLFLHGFENLCSLLLFISLLACLASV